MEAAERKEALRLTPGVYRFRNDGTRSFLNLFGAITNPNNPIIGYHDDGTAANLWQLNSVDSSAGTFTFQSGVESPKALYIQTKDQDFAPGAEVVSNTKLTVLRLDPQGNGLYRIHLTGDGENMVLALPNGNDWTPVRLETLNTDNQKQVWKPMK